MQLFTSILSFKIFGISEWSARFPSVLWGSIGVIIAFILTKKLSNLWGGFLAAFLYTILQLNHAYSTQAKPYTAIEVIMLIVIYLSSLVSEDFKNRRIHILAIFFASTASLYNTIGVITFVPYFAVLSPEIAKRAVNKKLFIAVIILFTLIIGWLARIYSLVPMLIRPEHNWSIFFKELFLRQYGLFTLLAILGVFTIKNKNLLIGIILSSSLLLYAWIFVQYSHNIRYLMPIIGLMVVFFGVFWGNVGDKLFNNSWWVCLIVALLVYAGSNKVIRKPSIYYTPNADFVGDVQNADYKVFFSEWRAKYPDFEKYTIFAGPFDSLSWYTQRYPTATFNRFYPSPIYYPQYGFTEYTNLDEFAQEMSKYPQGFVMIHDWISYMPDEIKDYVKKNLKFELRIESMAVSPNEKWPLALYSWGFDKE